MFTTIQWIIILILLVIMMLIMCLKEENNGNKNCYDKSSYKCLKCSKRKCKWHIIAKMINEKKDL